MLEENILDDNIDITYQNTLNTWKNLEGKIISIYPLLISLQKNANLNISDFKEKNYKEIIKLVYKTEFFKEIIKNIENDKEKTYYIIDDITKNHKTIMLKHLLKNYIYNEQITDKVWLLIIKIK